MTTTPPEVLAAIDRCRSLFACTSVDFENMPAAASEDLFRIAKHYVVAEDAIPRNLRDQMDLARKMLYEQLSKPNEPKVINGHEVYTDLDEDRPNGICDENHQTVLNQCKVCGRAESELDEPCTPKPSGDT